MTQYSEAELQSLSHELLLQSRETEWVEFKQNNEAPEDIGEYISALSNSAALYRKPSGYLLWGITDDTHEAVGTTFNPFQTKVGNEELLNWLTRLLNPQVHFSFNQVTYKGVPLVLLVIDAAMKQPIQFHGAEYIRVGTYKKRLKEHPELERELWRLFEETPWEERPALNPVSGEEILQLLDYPGYYQLFKLPLPEKKDILTRFEEERLIIKLPTGLWSISNLGALLFAHNLEQFPRLGRKALRIIQYQGISRYQTLREEPLLKGYAVGFSEMIEVINRILPKTENIQVLRENLTPYPDLAIRELVANALIHQDFDITGTGPMVEIFDNRMEITNPGVPLIGTERFLDSPPRSRNEKLAALLRRLGICEERGSGIDKVVFEIERNKLPAPIFELIQQNVRATLFSYKEFKALDREERIMATYLHACLKYVEREYVTNASLRERYGIDPKNSAIISRIINEAEAAHKIKPVDTDSKSRRHAKYWPNWA